MTLQQSSTQAGSTATPRTTLLRDHQAKGTDGTVRIVMEGDAQPAEGRLIQAQISAGCLSSARRSSSDSPGRHSITAHLTTAMMMQWSNYVYSAYAPQLASELAISSTRSI